VDGEAFQPMSFTLYHRFPSTGLSHRVSINNLLVIMQDEGLVCQVEKLKSNEIY